MSHAVGRDCGAYLSVRFAPGVAFSRFHLYLFSIARMPLPTRRTRITDGLRLLKILNVIYRASRVDVHLGKGTILLLILLPRVNDNAGLGLGLFVSSSSLPDLPLRQNRCIGRLVNA